MNLAERLASIENKAEIRDAEKTKPRPSGWEPGVVWHGSSGEITTDMLYDTPSDWDDILRMRGLDPEKFEVVNDTMRWCSWDGWRRTSDGETESSICYSFKAQIRQRSSSPEALDASLEEMYKSIRKVRPPKKEGLGGEETLVVALSDWQVGNRDGGGVEAQVKAIANLCESIPQRLSDLRKIRHNIGHILILGMGDMVEGTCFAAETEVITRDGIFTIEQLAKEGHATVKTEYGAWVDAEFRSFGIQDLRKITLTRGGSNSKVVYATPEHRWFRLESASSNSKRIEATTDELKPGDLLISNFGKHPQIMSPVGVMAGYVFGDGNRADKADRQRGCSVNIYRDDFSMLRFFDGHPQSEILRKKDEFSKFTQTEKSDYIKVSGLPSFMKDMPSLNESLSYLYGWAAGYFAADGSFTKGMLRLVSKDRENLERFEEVCARIGIGTNPIKVWKMSGTASESEFLYAISLVPSTVPIEFMIHEGKKAKFAEYLNSLSPNSSYTNQKNRARHWRVKSIEDSGRREEVYCAIVPNTHSFTLSNDLLTGNCGHYPAQQFRVELDRRDQVKMVRRGLRDIIVNSAPLVPKMSVMAIPGNHGENRQNGKSITSVHDNDDVAVFEQVAEILAMNPESFGHVGFRLSRDEIALGIDVSGHILAITHGHVTKPGANAGQTLWNWWQGQTMGRAYPVVADADILISGHYHHLNVKEQANRALFVCPSLTTVGEYFADATGNKAKSGTLSMVVAPDGWGELTLL